MGAPPGRDAHNHKVGGVGAVGPRPIDSNKGAASEMAKTVEPETIPESKVITGVATGVTDDSEVVTDPNPGATTETELTPAVETTGASGTEMKMASAAGATTTESEMTAAAKTL